MSKTPLMAQYSRIKEENPDSVLLFRMGDFFETFEDDAIIASKVLGSDSLSGVGLQDDKQIIVLLNISYCVF